MHEHTSDLVVKCGFIRYQKGIHRYLVKLITPLFLKLELKTVFTNTVIISPDHICLSNILVMRKLITK